jgi:hypothetical protein
MLLDTITSVLDAYPCHNMRRGTSAAPALARVVVYTVYNSSIRKSLIVWLNSVADAPYRVQRFWLCLEETLGSECQSGIE